MRLVGRGLGNSPGCSAALSQTRLPSLKNGNDSDSGAERGDRRDGSAAGDSSGSAMVTGTACDAEVASVCSLNSGCLQKTTCERNTKLTSHPTRYFCQLQLSPLTHVVCLLTNAPCAHFALFLFAVAQIVL